MGLPPGRGKRRFPPPEFPRSVLLFGPLGPILERDKESSGEFYSRFLSECWSLPVWPFLSAGAPSELCSVLCCIDTSNRGNRGESDARVSQREKKSLLSLPFPPLQAAGWLMFRAVFLIPGLSSSCRRRLSLWNFFRSFFSPLSSICHDFPHVFSLFDLCLFLSRKNRNR